jgi:hypothetical protein
MEVCGRSGVNLTASIEPSRAGAHGVTKPICGTSRVSGSHAFRPVSHKPLKCRGKFESHSHHVNSEQYQWVSWRWGWDSNPRYAHAHNGFRDRPVRPLRHPTAGGIRSGMERGCTGSIPRRQPLSCRSGRPYLISHHNIIENAPFTGHYRLTPAAPTL